MGKDENTIDASIRSILQGYLNIVGTDSVEVTIEDYLLLRKQAIYEQHLSKPKADTEPDTELFVHENSTPVESTPRYSSARQEVQKPEHRTQSVQKKSGTGNVTVQFSTAVSDTDITPNEVDILNSIKD